MECGDYDISVPRKVQGRGGPPSMRTAKSYVQEILAILPEDASFEAIQYHIDLRQRIEQGWEERDQRMADWLTNIFCSLTDRIALAKTVATEVSLGRRA